MRAVWFGRSAGAACAVAGCMPMLFAVAASVVGAAGAQGMGTGMAMGMGMGMMPAAPVEPRWVAALGALSWPLLVLSVVLLLWSFRGAPPVSRALSWAGAALLVANQLAMTPWLFFPALALVAAAFALARARRAPLPLAAPGGDSPAAAR